MDEGRDKAKLGSFHLNIKEGNAKRYKHPENENLIKDGEEGADKKKDQLEHNNVENEKREKDEINKSPRH